jgi:hypothetical protein
MRTTLRFWRWRRNTLRRGSDRAEACVVLVAALVLFLGAPFAGALAGLSMAAHAPRPAADWHRVTAVLVRNAPAAAATGWTAADTGNVQVAAEVRWTAANGSGRTGDAMVAPNSRAGQPVRIWLDAHGALRADPSDPAQAQARAVVFGLMAATATGLTVLGGRCVVLAAFNHRRAVALDREWAQVGPTWGHHPA